MHADEQVYANKLAALTEDDDCSAEIAAVDAEMLALGATIPVPEDEHDIAAMLCEDASGWGY